MATELKVPPVGESVTEVQIGEWLKPEGSTIRKDENLVTIESEKATIEIPAPADGVLEKILRKKGEIVKVGEVIAHLDAGTGTNAPAASATSPVAKAAAPAPATSSATGSDKVMPAAARVLAENKVDASAVTPTGPGGRLLKEDAQRHVAGVASAPAPAPEHPRRTYIDASSISR